MKPLILSTLERSQLCEYLLVAQQTMLELADTHARTANHSGLADTLRRYAGNAADLRTKVEGA